MNPHTKQMGGKTKDTSLLMTIIVDIVIRKWDIVSLLLGQLLRTSISMMNVWDKLNIHLSPGGRSSLFL